MSDKPKGREDATERPGVTLPGVVEKIIPPIIPSETEKAQITVEGADDLYKEIRVENTLEDQNGNTVKLKLGAEVEVTIEADIDATTPKDQSNANPSGQSGAQKKNKKAAS